MENSIFTNKNYNRADYFMKWVLLSLGIFFEIIALVFMKKSEGFTKLYPILFVFLFYSLSLVCLILVLKKMDASVAYAIWGSSGILIMALVGILWLNEPVTITKIVSMILIVLGVIGLEFF
jgi:small multidrug resistance pump